MSELLDAKVAEIKAAIAAETEQVKAALDALKVEIEDLKGEVAAGLSPEEVVAKLDELKVGVEAIYNPEVPVE